MFELPFLPFVFHFQTAQKRKSAGEPFSPVEKKVKSAARVTKKEKESTPKPKAVKKTVKNIKSPSASTPRQIKSPVNTPKHITSPRATVSKVATPKIPGKPASRHGTPKLTLAGRKSSRSRSPASSNVKKGENNAYSSKHSESYDMSSSKSSCVIS